MQGTRKVRIDVLLVERGFFPTRQKAQRAIMAGVVYIDEVRVDKAGTKVDINANIKVKTDPVPYVSRGGLKLEKAIEIFDIPVKGRTFLDVGASTGGFTDCLLKNGALRVYAIDVGYGQLDWKLRNDSRVVVLERMNIRYLTPDDLPELAQGAVIDVSFISLKLVVPVIRKLLDCDSHVIALIKPQFEAGVDKVGKKGIVRDPDIHKEVLFEIVQFIEKEGFMIVDLTYSPIKGSEGNIEFLVHFYKNKNEKKSEFDYMEKIPFIVDDAHRELF
ncbi:MAG TPA: TlyA family RNA methyltransferase [Clostridiales bacterium]|nr:TlyA family RNA methyltransferase [Clostridiales bacterium]